MRVIVQCRPFCAYQPVPISIDLVHGACRSWGGMIRQTTLAHRLLLKAHRSGGQDMQLRALLLIFKGYFEEEKDIGDVDVLADLSVEAGVVVFKEEVRGFYVASCIFVIAARILHFFLHTLLTSSPRPYSSLRPKTLKKKSSG